MEDGMKDGVYVGFGEDYDALDRWRMTSDFMWAMTSKDASTWRSEHLRQITREAFDIFQQYPEEEGGFTESDKEIAQFIVDAGERDYCLLRYAAFFFLMLHNEPYLRWFTDGAIDARQSKTTIKLASVERAKYFVKHVVPDAVELLLSRTQDPETMEYNGIDKFARHCISQYFAIVGCKLPAPIEEISQRRLREFDERQKQTINSSQVIAANVENTELRRKGLVPPPRIPPRMW